MKYVLTAVIALCLGCASDGDPQDFGVTPGSGTTNGGGVAGTEDTGTENMGGAGDGTTAAAGMAGTAGAGGMTASAGAGGMMAMGGAGGMMAMGGAGGMMMAGPGGAGP